MIRYNVETVFIGNKPLILTPLQRKLFLILWRAKGRVLTYEQLLDALYDIENDQPGINIIAVLLAKIRKQLPHTVKIVTIWGKGFKLVVNEISRIVKTG